MLKIVIFFKPLKPEFMSKKLIFTKLFFCEKCFDISSPTISDWCWIYDSRTQKYRKIKMELYLFLTGPLTFGFTPHIVVVNKETTPIIMCEFTCGICGVRQIPFPTKDPIDRDKISNHFIDLEDWKEFFKLRIA